MQSDNLQGTNRILALEVRSRATGFAVIDAPGHLVEWGRRKHKVTGSEFTRVVEQRIEAIINLCPPATIVVRTRKVRSLKARRRITAILHTIRRKAHGRSIEFRTISAKSIRQFFAVRQCHSKHQIATLVAHLFPQLSWKLPPKRKSWKSEDHRLMIFDAAATALAFLNKSPPGD